MMETSQSIAVIRNLLFGWGCLVGIYFLFAEIYIWRKTGVNMWKVWWRTDTDSIKTERRFSEEIRQFQKLNILYRAIKWTTPAIMIACLVLAYLVVFRRT